MRSTVHSSQVRSSMYGVVVLAQQLATKARGSVQFALVYGQCRAQRTEGYFISEQQSAQGLAGCRLGLGRRVVWAGWRCWRAGGLGR